MKAAAKGQRAAPRIVCFERGARVHGEARRCPMWRQMCSGSWLCAGTWVVHAGLTKRTETDDARSDAVDLFSSSVAQFSSRHVASSCGWLASRVISRLSRDVHNRSLKSDGGSGGRPARCGDRAVRPRISSLPTEGTHAKANSTACTTIGQPSTTERRSRRAFQQDVEPLLAAVCSSNAAGQVTASAYSRAATRRASFQPAAL